MNESCTLGHPCEVWRSNLQVTFNIMQFLWTQRKIKEIRTLNFVDIKHLFILILKIFFHWKFVTKSLLFPFSKQKQSLSSEMSSTSSKWLTTETTTFKMSVSKGKPDGSESVLIGYFLKGKTEIESSVQSLSSWNRVLSQRDPGCASTNPG